MACVHSDYRATAYLNEMLLAAMGNRNDRTFIDFSFEASLFRRCILYT